MTANAAAVSGGAVSRFAGHTRHRPHPPAIRSLLAAQFRRARRGRRSPTTGPEGRTVYQAAAALPHSNRRHATEALRDQLSIMAVAGGLTPDWTTLAVTGPTEVTSTRQGAHFEWAGRVALTGAAHSAPLPDPDDFPQRQPEDDPTMPLRIHGTWPTVLTSPGGGTEEAEG